jgi:peptidoglycan/xylan/chitin deacetylase (PgdA/CDA1 family)
MIKKNPINFISSFVVSALVIFLFGGLLFPDKAYAQEPIRCGTPSSRMVALTFDDGPSRRYTPKILNLLQRYQVHATFFVLGQHARAYPEIVKALVKAGNEIGNHTFSHPRLTKLNQTTRELELERTRLELDLLNCPSSLLFRPPYTIYDSSLEEYLDHIHMRMILWDVDSGDWQGLSANKIVARVLNRVHPGSIIVFHDNDENDAKDHSLTVAALEIIIPVLLANGYKLVTVSEMLDPPNINNKLAKSNGVLPLKKLLLVSDILLIPAHHLYPIASFHHVHR